jgi:hypothetical protein
MDASNVESFMIMGAALIIAPLKTIMIVAILLNKVNCLMLSGFLFFMFLMFPLQFLTSRLFGVLKYG